MVLKDGLQGMIYIYRRIDFTGQRHVSAGQVHVSAGQVHVSAGQRHVSAGRGIAFLSPCTVSRYGDTVWLYQKIK
jgi:hypothetical protein